MILALAHLLTLLLLFFFVVHLLKIFIPLYFCLPHFDIPLWANNFCTFQHDFGLSHSCQCLWLWLSIRITVSIVFTHLLYQDVISSGMIKIYHLNAPGTDGNMSDYSGVYNKLKRNMCGDSVIASNDPRLAHFHLLSTEISAC
jgi:hypothetical protein